MTVSNFTIWFAIFLAGAFANWQDQRPGPSPSSPNTTLDGIKLPLAFEDNFEKGCDRWETTDDTAWDCKQKNGSTVFGINKRKSSYEPKHRSPHNIALIKNVALSDFVLTFDVMSTKDTGNHRDCCVLFSHQDKFNFYYVHLGAKPDPASGQIMIVANAPRKPLTTNTKKVRWSNKWHKVKVTRIASTGKTCVYFDNMDKPHMSVVDKTLGKGQIGIGSFDDMNDFDNVVLYGR